MIAPTFVTNPNVKTKASNNVAEHGRKFHSIKGIEHSFLEYKEIARYNVDYSSFRSLDV